MFYEIGELFSDFEFLDKHAVGLYAEENEELKLLLISKRNFILWIDKACMISYRETENIVKERFWWWLDK